MPDKFETRLNLSLKSGLAGKIISSLAGENLSDMRLILQWRGQNVNLLDLKFKLVFRSNFTTRGQSKFKIQRDKISPNLQKSNKNRARQSQMGGTSAI